MPHILPIAATAAAAAAPAAAAATASASLTATLVSVASQAAVSMAINAAMSVLSPKVGVGGRPVDWTLNPDAPIPFAFGRVGVAGTVIHKRTFGPDKMNNGFVTVVSGAGPIDGYEQMYADDLSVNFDSAGKCTTPEWNGELFRVSRLGNQPDTWLPTPTGLKNNSTLPSWTSAHRASGKAIHMLVMVENSKGSAFPNGEAKPRQVLRGLKCWDPRRDSTWPGGSGTCRLDNPSTWVFSQNPAIFALKWALGLWEDAIGKGTPHVGQQVGGIGAKLSGIDVPALISAANVADAHGWTCAAYPNTDDDKHQVLVSFLQAAGALYAQKAGKISCIQRAAPRASVATITADDVIGAIEVDTAASRIDRINTIQPSYWSPQHRWQMTALPEVTAEAYREQDGGKRSRGVSYPYVTNANQAAQLAALQVAHSRESMAGQVALKPHLQRLQPGDAFTISEPGFLLDGVKCLVMNTEYDPAEAVVRVTFVSETDGKYPFALGQSTVPPVPPTLTASGPVSPPGAEDWIIVPRPPAEDGSQLPGFDLEGVVSNDMATAVIVEWGPAATGPWTQAYSGPPNVTRIPIYGVQPGATYYIAVRYQVHSQFSERYVYGPYVAPDFVAGDVMPTGPNVQELLENIETERDLAITNATAAIEEAQTQFDTALTDVQTRLDGVWEVVGETDEEGLRQTVIDILENGTGGGGLTELTTRVEGIEQVVNASGEQALARQTDLTELETAIDATYAKVTTVSNLTSRVTSAEGVNTAQNTRLNTVETELDGKASSTSVSNLSSTLATKPNTFAQSSAPSTSGRITGDLWMDTDDSNQLYRWNGSAWAAVHDLRGEAAVAELAAARNGSANLSAQLGVMRQTVTDGLAGKASATDFNSLRSEVTTARGGAASLNSRLNTVEAEVDGKASSSSVTNLESSVSVRTRTFSQTSAPANPTGGLPLVVGDIWFDSNDNFQQYRWSGSAWVTQHDLRGEAAMAEVTAARGGQTNLNARFTQVNQTITDGLAGKASTSSVTALSSTVGGHTSSITNLQSTTASINGLVSAKVGLVLNSNGKISGFSSTNDGVTSTFDIQADKVRFTNGTTAVAPFSVSGSTVFMTNVMIRSGTAGERMELTPSQLRVYDANNVLRVRIGLF